MLSSEIFNLSLTPFAACNLPALDGLIERRDKALLRHISAVLPGVLQATYKRESNHILTELVIDSAHKAGFDQIRIEQLASQLAQILDADVRLSVISSADTDAHYATARRDPRLLIPMPPELQQRYGVSDCREVSDLIGELLLPPVYQLEQPGEWFKTLEQELAAEIFESPRVRIRAGTIELELQNHYEDILQEPLQRAIARVLEVLPEEYSVVVLTERCSHSRIVADLNPVNNVGAQDEVSRAMRRNSADALLSESLPISRVSQIDSGLEVVTNFDLLPEWTKERLITRLQQFGVPVRLVQQDLQLEHSDDLLEQIGRCLRFCLPKSTWLQKIEQSEEGIEVELSGSQIAGDELAQLQHLVQGIWRVPMQVTVEQLDPIAANELSNLGRRHAAALARLADSDGVIRAPLKQIAEVITFELVRDVPEGTYRLPAEAIERGYPKVTIPFTAIGRPGSLQEDAFNIIPDKVGCQLTVAIADASWLAPQESYIGHEMMAHGISLYDRNLQLPSVPRDILNKYGGFSRDSYRPAVLVQMTIDFSGRLNAHPKISLGSIKLTREISPQRYREVVDARSHDDRLQIVNFSHLTDLLQDKRIDDGGLVWFDDERSVDEVQVLVNQVLPAFALENNLPQLVRAHPAPNLDTRRSYIERLISSFSQIDAERFQCPDVLLMDDKKFKRRLHSMLSLLDDDARREAFRLLRLSTRYSATPGDTNFFQEGKVYAQYTGTFRRLAAKINLEQISRHLRGESVRDQAEMERFEDYCRQLEFSMRYIGDTLRVGALIGRGMDLKVMQGRHGYRAALAPDLVAQFDPQSQKTASQAGIRTGETVHVEVIGYDLKMMRALIRLV